MVMSGLSDCARLQRVRAYGLKMAVKLVCHSLLAFNGLRLMGMSFIARRIIHSLET